MSDKLIGVPLKEVAIMSRKIGPEGMVLLKNNDICLPLLKDDNVAVFGRCQIDFYRSGTGSGGSVNVPYTVNLVEGLLNANVNIDKKLLKIYQDWIKDNPYDVGTGFWAGEPWNQEEMEVNDILCEDVAKRNNKAIIVIGRTAGEDKDYSFAEGSYLLTDKEKLLIDTVTKYFSNVILLFNVSNIIDMNYIISNYNDKIKSILYVWQGGMEGGNSTADALTGKNGPSGKLTDTIAKNITDYPSNDNYGSLVENMYQEDIYVGYRYFSTFKPESVIYPFGYGLTYTKFDFKVLEANYNDENINIKILVKNIGNQYSSKEVMQLYLSAPIKKLGRPKLELIGFKKTMLLAPGEDEILDFNVSINNLAAYDDTGITGHKSAYVLENGTYNIFVGNSSSNLMKVEFENKIILENTILVKKLNSALCPNKKIRRLKATVIGNEIVPSYEEISSDCNYLEKRIFNNLPEELEFTGYKGFKLIDVKNKKCTLDAFVNQIPNEELAMLVRGEGMCSPKVTPGVASCFGGVAEILIDKYGIPLACTSDGPSGIRMDVGYIASQVPIGTLLASSWNEDMVEELFYYEGLELKQNEIDSLLGPGINIHRHPLCGRNFEYFSEDPLLAGKIGAAICRGLGSAGAFATIKHMACNNQETKRNDVNSLVSERALREIYLKPFEICVKEGNAKSIMTSYNPINGHWTASNYDLLTTILRNEWGYDGIVMTDWWAMVNNTIIGGTPNRYDLASMIKAQNDLYMVVDNFGAVRNSSNDNIISSLENGYLTRGELVRSAKNICNFLMNTFAMERGKGEMSSLKKYLLEKKVSIMNLEDILFMLR